MGNQPSTPTHASRPTTPGGGIDRTKYKSFPGSAILEKTFCGSIDTTDPGEYEGVSFTNRLLKKADIMCISSPNEDEDGHSPRYFRDTESEAGRPINPSSALLARALVSEVTNNPKTMKPSEMAQREYKLLKAQEAAAKRGMTGNPSIPVGAPGGVGPPQVLQSFAYACTGDETAGNVCVGAPSHHNATVDGPLSHLNGYDAGDGDDLAALRNNPYFITIGLCMSRRYAHVGHPDSITRQTAYDFNEIQDRSYKYVSSTDKYGWRGGGGEVGGPVVMTASNGSDKDGASSFMNEGVDAAKQVTPSSSHAVKEPNPDTVHIPIIHIDCASQEAVDQVIHAVACGEIFIPHMSIQPESIAVQGVSPPDLVVRFGCERNEDVPPDDWPNWCLEFMHNQLYEYFYSAGARWMKRPFSVTLARKVRWKTVKHMNRYFSHCEKVIEGWREKGPQYLDPQLSCIEGGASPDEVARPHGIYLMRRGVPTNYFAPNFEPPYTTKMTRSLLQNVLEKSWDKKRREWSSEPIPKLVTPSVLMAVACGCADPSAGGFMANQVTNSMQPMNNMANQQQSQYNNNNRPQHQQYHQPQHQQPYQQPQYQQGQLQALSPRVQQQQLLQRQQQQQQQDYWPQQDQMHQHPLQLQEHHLEELQRQLQEQNVDAHSVVSSHVVESVVEFDTKPDPRMDANVHSHRHKNKERHHHQHHDDDDKDDIVSQTGVGEDEVDDHHHHHEQQQHNDDDDDDDGEEEKKSECVDVRPKSSTTSRDASPRQKSSSSSSRKMDESVATRSVAQSAATTVHHHGNNNKKNSKSATANANTRARSDGGGQQQQQLYSDEDWEDEPAKENMADPPGEKTTASSPLGQWPNSKKTTLDQERQNHSVLMAKVKQSTTNNTKKGGLGAAQAALDRDKAKQPHYTMHANSPRRDICPSESGASLDYSVDGSSAFSTVGEGSLVGQQFVAADSQSDATGPTFKNKQLKKHQKEPDAQSPKAKSDDEDEEEEDDDASEVDSQVTSSTMATEVIPSDEELFAVGWAKALDANSGNYYYFTLDRSKTVWENPLAVMSPTSERGD